MKILGTIRAHDVFPDMPERPDSSFGNLRKTVRLALLDSEGKFGFILYPKREGFPDDYYGFLGGGVHEGETLDEALRREAREEVGCELKDVIELGLIREFGTDRKDQAAESYCYFARVAGEKGIPQYDAQEAASMARPAWLTREEIRKMHAAQVPGFSKYRAQFIFAAVDQL